MNQGILSYRGTEALQSKVVETAHLNMKAELGLLRRVGFQEDFQQFHWQFLRSWNWFSLHEQKLFLIVKNKQMNKSTVIREGNVHELPL